VDSEAFQKEFGNRLSDVAASRMGDDLNLGIRYPDVKPESHLRVLIADLESTDCKEDILLGGALEANLAEDFLDEIRLRRSLAAARLTVMRGILGDVADGLVNLPLDFEDPDDEEPEEAFEYPEDTCEEANNDSEEHVAEDDVEADPPEENAMEEFFKRVALKVCKDMFKRNDDRWDHGTHIHKELQDLTNNILYILEEEAGIHFAEQLSYVAVQQS
jgi:hypothetical protein